MCLAAMAAAGTSLKAQEVTIVLNPGWTWISNPSTDTLDFATALGSFTPAVGDIIKSQWGSASYMGGQWRGTISQFYPGYGYKYKSKRTVPVQLTMGTPLPQVSVTTAEPGDITATSAVVGSTVTIGEGNHLYARGVCWGTEEMPTVDGSHTSGEAVAGSQSITLEGLTPSTTYHVRAYMVTDCGLAYGNEQSFTTRHEFVDLGLPSGTLWATCNVGANTPEEYGNYFAWGETQPKEIYNWSTYQYCNGSYNTLTKYCNQSDYGNNDFTDGLTILLPEDDAATANWGADWRMPTGEEWQELIDNTTCTWTTRNGVNGRLYTASNGNSLFLPAAGYRLDGSLYRVGTYGNYWSSSLYTEDPNFARNLYSHTSNYYMYNYYRFNGFPIRPVSSTSPTPTFIIDATANPAEGGEVSGGGTYQAGAECTLTATSNEGYTFTSWTENDEVVSTDAIYTFTVDADRNLMANFTYNGGGDEHAYVDLGLPSGLLWATCNVGADNPEDYGDYFAWGETMPKDTYDWSTYQYCNGSSYTLTKYCSNSNYGYNGFTDNLTTLLPEDAAATANWGNDWRMPTKEEWQELYNNTTVTWTTQNGVNGRLFTASNGNSLFLPAAGYRYISSLDYAGSYGSYWSSSLSTGSPDGAWILYFGSDNYGMNGYGYRDYGLSVRPVRAGSQSNVPTGAIDGLFSVSATQQVYFSQGNLQYQASTNTWRFAENQWDYVGTQTPDNQGNVGGTVSGSDNRNISSTYNGWIDLFGWGTSGWNNGNTYYHPWDSNNSNSSLYGPPGQYNLTGSYANADWGVYNPISNGGNTANQWRTLTQPEWNYVFNTRTTTSGIRYAKANVNNVNGVILLPDDWSSSTYSLSNTNSSGASFSSNTLTASQWSILEQAGAVFLPAAGGRFGTSVRDVGSYGYYWSASYDYSNSAYRVYFYDSYLYTNLNSYNRCGGQSVRLVCPAE